MNGGYRHDFSTAIIIICMLIISGTVRLVQEMQGIVRKMLTHPLVYGAGWEILS